MGDLLHRQQPSVEQDRRPVGGPLDLGQDVGGHQHGAVLRQVPEQPAQLDDLPGVEAVARLVENEQFRLVQHGLGERHALPVAARQPLDDDAAHAAERQPLDRGVDGAVQGPAGDAAQPPHEGEVLDDAHVPVERRILRHVADALPGGAGGAHDVDAGNPDGPRARIEVAGDEPQDGALAGAVRPEQAEDLALPHLEGNAIDRQSRAEALAQPVERKDGHMQLRYPARRRSPDRPRRSSVRSACRADQS